VIIIYHLLKLGQSCSISIIANHGCIIASLIVSLSSVNFDAWTLFAKLHQASIAKAIGLNGGIIFQVGVVFVFAQIGVVGEDCPVVRA